MQLHTSNSPQTVTVSFFRYPPGQRRWGMKQMWVSRKKMREMQGLVFFKPFGTGSGSGFSVWPDFSTYGILAVWESQEMAELFAESGYYKELMSHSAEQYTIFLNPLSSRGAWSGFSAWSCLPDTARTGIIAVITRATIKPRFAFRFWSLVPRTSKAHERAQGMLFARGIGENPFNEQATFSIWQDEESMTAFAYRTFHAKAVMETHKRNGFREEMYTRLKPFRAIGTWGGTDPLQAHIHTAERSR
jgi:spheroidene monooxygenase